MGVHLIRRLLFSLLVMLVMPACKPAGQSSVASLENFAAQETLKENRCIGSAASLKSASVETLLESLDGPIDSSLRIAVRESLAAVPAKVRRLFMDLGGRIKLVPDTESLCGQFLGETKYGGRTGNTIEGCFIIREADGEGNPAQMVVVLKSEVLAIQHGLVREFGYLFSQYISRLRVTRSGDKITAVSGNEDSPGMARRKTALANAFLSDLLNGGAFDMGSAEAVLGANAAKRIPSLVKAGAEDVVMSSGADAQRQQRFKDFIFAEAFDSYYCSGAAAVKAKELKKIAKKAPLDRAALTKALAQTRNSRVVMALLFPNSLDVFNKIHPKVFGRNSKTGFGLADGECLDDGGTISSSTGVIPGLTSEGLFSAGSANALATDELASNTPAGNAFDTSAFSLGEGALMNPASPQQFSIDSQSADSTAMLANVESVGQDANFDTNTFKKPMSYPEQTDGNGPADQAIAAASMYQNFSFDGDLKAAQPVRGESETAFALSGVGKTLCKKVETGIDVLENIGNSGARLLKKTGSIELNGLATPARRIGVAAEGGSVLGGLTAKKKTFPSPDGFDEASTQEALARRADLHKGAISANSASAAPDGIFMPPNFAKDNAIHTNRIVNSIAKNGEELSSLGLDINRMKVGAAWHDVGKTDLLPNDQLADVMVNSAKRNGQEVTKEQAMNYLQNVPASDAFMTQRIMLHEFHSIGKMDDELVKLGYKAEQIDLLKRDVLWHNDGGQQAGTFWHDNFKSRVPIVDYGKP